MKVAKEELTAILGQYNPWWRGQSVQDLPSWRRAAYHELHTWLIRPPAHRATMISGARQVGKTTLLMQAIDALLEQGIPPANILYVTFDHPLLKMAGIEEVLDTWREREPKKDGLEYIFLDEAQFVRDWGTWIKHQVDFFKQRRIFFTGSATPLLHADQESGVGRWHTIRLATLSFYEYLQLKEVVLPNLPKVKSLRDLLAWQAGDFQRVSEIADSYIAHFHEFLLRGGFPQTVRTESVTQAQKLLREDIIDKALKRDMTAFFGVRRVLDLEQTFLYLCMHDSGLLDMAALCSNLEVKRPTAQHFIELLEATHLIYRLPHFGYGKEILRTRYKIYLADAAIAPAVLLKGRSVLEDPIALGVAAEAAVFRHLFARYYKSNVRFTYWRDKKHDEIDLIAETEGRIIPFEVKYRSSSPQGKDVRALLTLCQNKDIDFGCVVTRSVGDLGFLKHDHADKHKILTIPATLMCYWLGETELSQYERQPNPP